MARPARTSRPTRAAKTVRPRWTLPLLFGVLALLVAGGWYVLTRGSNNAAPTDASDTGAAGSSGADVVMPHLHGLGYSADGRELIVPAHEGLRVFADGAWHTPDVPAHDYMGYAPTDDGFYSSGHPAPGSDLVNPLGLVKSTDGGKTLQPLGFVGESDFHGMAVGYKNHAVYVLNPQPNARLGAGMYYSLDDGKTWQQSAAQGVHAQPYQLAAHPTQASVVALATDGGLLLSTDHGNSFTPIAATGPVTAAAFSADGGRLLFGSTTLSVYDLASKQIATLKLPPIDPRDTLTYIAVNPVQPQELAIATVERNIYRSQDGGQNWQQITNAGVGRAAR